MHAWTRTRRGFWRALAGLLLVAMTAGLPQGAADRALAAPAQARSGAKPGLPYSSFLPIVSRPPACPKQSSAQFGQMAVVPPAQQHPDSQHGDLNLSLRGWESVAAPLVPVLYNGDTDGDPVQLAAIFADGRTPAFTHAYQVYDWNWSCPGHPDGCKGSLLPSYPSPVTLLSLASNRGEPIRPPSRGATIDDSRRFHAVVLYAEERRITLGYTKDDSVANGYAVHIENVCVDPNLLALYRQLNAAGRSQLPGLDVGQALGTAFGSQISVSVRDKGTFWDPRSCKDWWQNIPTGQCRPMNRAMR